jgi:hypothetical protein
VLPSEVTLRNIRGPEISHRGLFATIDNYPELGKRVLTRDIYATTLAELNRILEFPF